MATLKKFKESLNAPFVFLSDEGGKVAEQYGGTQEGYAKRVTFVIGKDRQIGHTDEGMNAIIPDTTIDACPSSVGPVTMLTSS